MPFGNACPLPIPPCCPCPLWIHVLQKGKDAHPKGQGQWPGNQDTQVLTPLTFAGFVPVTLCPSRFPNLPMGSLDWVGGFYLELLGALGGSESVSALVHVRVESWVFNLCKTLLEGEVW